MLHTLNTGRFYALSIFLLCLSYLIFQLFNNHYAVWSVDDFWFAHRIYEFKNGIPYRDFSPYKTVLGYYLLLPTMTLGHDALTPLLYTKHFIAVLNTVFFGIAATWLTRFFPKPAILMACTLLMFSTFVLSYSTNIRVDLLAYWFCLFSFLFLLNNQFLWAGIIIGIAFLTSQKVLWYIFASDVALMAYWLITKCHKKIFWGAVLFNTALLITISIYIGIWSWFAGLQTVLYNLFYEAYIMFQLDVYDSTRRFFWGYTLTNNPFIFLLWPFTLISCFISPSNDNLLDKRIVIVTYASVILFCLIPYKQVFPYYMLTTLPAFILLYTAFFSWVLALLQDKSLPTFHFIDKNGFLGFMMIYIFSFSYIMIIFVLSPACLLIAFIPLLLGLKILSKTNSTLMVATPSLIFLIMLIMGLVYPLILLTNSLKKYSGEYQQSMIQLTDVLLNHGGDYLAGIELIYNKNQPIPGMRHLDVPALEYLYQPTSKLANAMLPSLYHTPDISISKAIHYLESSSVKFYVNNYRIESLPARIKYYLKTHYAHYWGSIYLYAPMVKSGQKKIGIKFSGKYRVATQAAIKIDGITLFPNTIIELSRGSHMSYAKNPYRLLLQEDKLDVFLNPRFKKDNWLMMLG